MLLPVMADVFVFGFWPPGFSATSNGSDWQ
jgi:hypothetical protein